MLSSTMRAAERIQILLSGCFAGQRVLDQVFDMILNIALDALAGEIGGVATGYVPREPLPTVDVSQVERVCDTDAGVSACFTNLPKWVDWSIRLPHNPVWEDNVTREMPMNSFLPPKPRSPNGKIRDAQDLGEAIRARRRQLGLTQVQLAKSCRCSPRFIGKLERSVAGGNIKQVISVCREIGMDLYVKVRGA